MINYQDIHKKVRANIDGATVLLQKYIQIPSVSGEEKEIGEEVMHFLKSMNFEVQNFEAQKNRPNLISEWHGTKPGKRFVFHCGLDVIPPVYNSKMNPWSGQIRDGYVYGRGSSDAKSGLCAALMAVRLLKEMGFDPAGSILMSFVSDSERYGSFGVKELLKKNLLTGDFGICTAATSGKILLRHCGAVSVGITYMADYKWVYLNHSHKDAIEKMMLAINALNAFSRELSETTAEEFKKVPRITITELKGGIAPNIKSPTASFTVDRRLIPGETVDEVHRQIMGVLDELKTSDSEMEYVYEVFGEYSCLDVDENEEIVASAARAYKQVMGKDIEKAWRIGGSDASDIVLYTGMPMPNFSCGIDSDETYSAEERVNLEQYYSFIEIYMLMLVDLLSE